MGNNSNSLLCSRGSPDTNDDGPYHRPHAAEERPSRPLKQEDGRAFQILRNDRTPFTEYVNQQPGMRELSFPCDDDENESQYKPSVEEITAIHQTIIETYKQDQDHLLKELDFANSENIRLKQDFQKSWCESNRLRKYTHTLTSKNTYLKRCYQRLVDEVEYCGLELTKVLQTANKTMNNEIARFIACSRTGARQNTEADIETQNEGNKTRGHLEMYDRSTTTNACLKDNTFSLRTHVVELKDRENYFNHQMEKVQSDVWRFHKEIGVIKDEKDNLRIQNEGLAAEVKVMQKENEDLQRELKECKNVVDKTNCQKSDLNEEHRCIMQKCEMLQQNLRDEQEKHRMHIANTNVELEKVKLGHENKQNPNKSAKMKGEAWKGQHKFDKLQTNPNTFYSGEEKSKEIQENQSLLERIRVLELENADFKKRNIGLEKAQCEHRKLMDTLESVNAAFRQESSDATCKAKQLGGELDQMRKINDGLQSRCSEFQQNDQLLTGRMESSHSREKQERLKLQGTIENLQRANRTLENDNQDQHERLNEKSKRLEDLKNEYRSLLMEKENELKSLKTKLANLYEESCALKTQQASLYEELCALKKTHSMCAEREISLQENANRVQTDIQKKRTLHQTEIENVETKLKSAKDDLIRQNERHRNEVKDINLTLQSAKVNQEKDMKAVQSKMQEERETYKKTTDKYKTDIAKLDSEIADLQNRAQTGTSETQHGNEDLKRKLQNANDDLREARRELDDTKTRLSKLMGQKLTDNNPNITDLSDKNRPTKLAERFTELYDNQWTDAFEVIDKGNEQDTIGCLIQILNEIMQFCKAESEGQLEQLRTIVVMANNSRGVVVSDTLNKQLKDCRKAAVEESKEQLYQKYLTHLRGSGSPTPVSLKIPQFLKECFEVCWLMSIQDPPVVLGPELNHGDPFNTDIYKAYTTSGPTVDYVVWPALYLYQGGAILCKGVAQGYGNRKKKLK